MKAYAVHENGSQEVRLSEERAYPLTVGGGSPDKATPACCYAPNGNFCGAFLPTETSATLETKYHYGSGGDAVLIVIRRTNE